MKDPEGRFTEIARIGKAHGLDGTVKLLLNSDIAPEGLICAGEILHLENRRGDLIPARIKQVRVERKRNVLSFFVHFDQITDRSQAEGFQDGPVYTDRNRLEPDHNIMETVPDITGFLVSDPSGIEAVVTGILESPAHPVIRMESGTTPFLVPWVDEFVVSVDMENRSIRCRELDQFLNL